MPGKTPEYFMRRAVALSRRGFPQPNPHVGCVIVRDGEIVGEGWHEFQGDPHAEVVALTAAGSRAKGATAFVTLEPCNHTGRTGPCSVALRDAGISRVVYACADPNPKAMGGADFLRAAGVEVLSGLLEDRAMAANLRFLRSHQLGRPYVVVKAAITLDGRISLATGESKWITGPRARKEGHRLRAECGAVLVGRKTVGADDPLLTARLPGVRHQPLRIVLDPARRLSGKERVFGEEAETLWLSEGGPVKFEKGKADLGDLLAYLYSRNVNGLLVEGGGETIARFFESGLVDRLELFLGPKVFGEGPHWVEKLRIPSSEQSPVFELSRVRKIGPDVQLSYNCV